MHKSPIFWGILISIASLIAWVISIVFNVLTLGAFRWVSNVLLVIALASLPVALLWKLISRKHR